MMPGALLSASLPMRWEVASTMRGMMPSNQVFADTAHTVRQPVPVWPQARGHAM
eukprot:NODE_17108_length_218_cov_0.840491.p3 GENE.NODE_17108_length_218_cov_0.840491~~NODE_17108_length_218_cov_0.840491.p3  ORF type:complete len:54 (-),score=8.31 NODE_17108_length_218_cov_0.840491:57-218(-)